MLWKELLKDKRGMNLLLTGCFNYSNDQISALQSLGCTIHFIQYENDALPVIPSEVEAVVCNGLFLSHDIEQFSSLKYIQLTSAGFDRVPIDRIKERGINIHNARGVYSTPMAEWALFRVLEHFKQGQFFREEQKGKRWTKHRGLREVAGIKLAVIGAGNVGQEVAKRFQALGAETTGFDIHTNETVGFNHMALTSTLKDHIGEFDVVVITAPLLPSTQGLISHKVLNSLKADSMLVNISRGGLIDESALYDFLKKRNDVYAALDVFEIEPLPSDSPLWQLENVAISPHNSFVSDGNNGRMFKVIYENLKEFINR